MTAANIAMELQMGLISNFQIIYIKILGFFTKINFLFCIFTEKNCIFRPKSKCLNCYYLKSDVLSLNFHFVPIPIDIYIPIPIAIHYTLPKLVGKYNSGIQRKLLDLVNVEGKIKYSCS